MKKCTVGLLVLGLMVGVAFPASAQMVSYIRELTGFGGMTFNGTDEATAGAALSMNLTTRLGIEGEAGIIFADDTTFNGSLNLLLNLGTGVSPFVPYIIGGAGFLSGDGTDIALNAGIGLKIFIEPNMALRTDFRGFFISEGGDIEDVERLYGGVTIFF